MIWTIHLVIVECSKFKPFFTIPLNFSFVYFRLEFLQIKFSIFIQILKVLYKNVLFTLSRRCQITVVGETQV